MARCYARTPLTRRQPTAARARLPAAPAESAHVIDYFTLALIHGLLVIAALRLLGRDDLDSDPPIDTTPVQPVETAADRRRARR